MARNDVWKKAAAGAFFIACITLIVGVVFVIGLEKGFTEPKFKMTALFHKIGGLSAGAPVRLSGVTVGTVADISFLREALDGRSVKVSFSIYKKYEEQVRKYSQIAIITEGVLGDKIVEITTDPSAWHEDLSRPIPGEDPLNVQNLAETFGTTARALSEATESIDEIVGEVKMISYSVKRVMNRIEQRIIEGSLFKVF